VKKLQHVRCEKVTGVVAKVSRIFLIVRTLNLLIELGESATEIDARDGDPTLVY